MIQQVAGDMPFGKTKAIAHGDVAGHVSWANTST